MTLDRYLQRTQNTAYTLVRMIYIYVYIRVCNIYTSRQTVTLFNFLVPIRFLEVNLYTHVRRLRLNYICIELDVSFSL